MSERRLAVVCVAVWVGGSLGGSLGGSVGVGCDESVGGSAMKVWVGV
jgi:hypothetical protein